MGAAHTALGWVVIGWCAATGLWGVGATAARRPVGPFFAVATVAGLVLAVVQALVGVVLLAGGADPGSFHLFYGVVVVFVAAFAYVNRGVLAVAPGLRWGLLLLFVAGLGIRSVQTFGASL